MGFDNDETSLNKATVAQMGCRGPGSTRRHSVLIEADFKHVIYFIVACRAHAILSFRFYEGASKSLRRLRTSFPLTCTKWLLQHFFSLLCGRISRFSRRRVLAASLCRVLTQAVSKRTTQSDVSS